MSDFLSSNSKTWQKYKNGDISSEDLHIVFYACGASSVVQEISKYEAFKDVTFIAPDRKLHVGKDGYSTEIAHVDTNTKDISKGKWHTFKNGSEPKIFGNYYGDEKPGTKNFNYEWTIYF